MNASKSKFILRQNDFCKILYKKLLKTPYFLQTTVYQFIIQLFLSYQQMKIMSK